MRSDTDTSAIVGPLSANARGSMPASPSGESTRYAPYPEEQVLAVTLDIDALRRHRTVANHNTWVDLRTEGFKQLYSESLYPANRFPSGKPPRTLSEKIELCEEVFRKLYERGQFTPPGGYTIEEASRILIDRIEYAQKTGRLKKSG